MKKQVLLISPPESIHTKRWKDFLIKKGYEVKIASRIKKGISDFSLSSGFIDKEKDIENMGIVLKEILSKNKFDVVHVHFATKYGHVLESIPSDIHKIISVWGEDVLDEAQNEPILKERLKKALYSADIITTTSKHMNNFLMNVYKISGNRIKTIVWGYDEIKFRRKTTKDFIFKIPKDKKIVLSARVCRPQNNIQNIISAFKLLNKEDVVLVILTGQLADSSYVKLLKEENKQYNKIIFLPTLSEEELSCMYNKSEVIISIPDVDQLSTTVLESLACGTPVICSDIEVYRERVINAHNGWLIDPHNVDQIKRTILKSLDSKKDLSNNAINSVSGDGWNFNSLEMIKTYEN
jgi:glycosyltransferase involved in cell wall biosynthesis